MKRLFNCIVIFISGLCIGFAIGRISYNKGYYEYDKFFRENKAVLQDYNAIEREEIWKRWRDK